MGLLNKYINKVVGKIWFNKNAYEIQLRKMLDDKLGDDNSQEHVVAVIKDIGHPSEVANIQNINSLNLFSNRFSGLYLMTIKVVCVAILLGLTIGNGISLLTSELTVGNMIRFCMNLIPRFITSTAFGIAIITVVFIIMDRINSNKLEEMDVPNRKWDPIALLNLDNKKIVKQTRKIECFIFGFLIIFLKGYGDNIGLYLSQNGSWIFGPLYQAFTQVMPYMVMILAFRIILNLRLIRIGRWTRNSRLMQVFVSLGDLLVFTLLMLSIEFATINSQILNSQMRSVVVVLDKVLVTIVFVVFITILVKIVKDLYELIVMHIEPKEI